VTHQEFYPLLKIKDENDFADLSEDLHTIVKSLNTYKLVVRNGYEDTSQSNIQEISTNQVHKQQESIE
ncbi:32351_t:CDS:1, partial [Racocetra persica]